MGLRARNKKQKLDSILAAARALFVENGYAGTTTRAVARRAGVAVGTLFVYFPEKRDMLVAVVRGELDAAIDTAFAALARQTPSAASAPRERRVGVLVGQLVSVFGAIFSVYEGSQELSRVFVKEQMFVDDARAGEMAGWTLQFVARLSQLITAAQARGEVARDTPPLLAASHCFSSYLFVLLAWLNNTLTVRDRDQMLAQSLALTMRGLAPRPHEEHTHD